MATYRLNQTLKDGTIKPIEFTIPDEAGKYRLTFVTSDGQTFTQDIEKGVKEINKTVSGRTGTTKQLTHSGNSLYEYKTTINVGIGTISNLTTTTDADEAYAQYDPTTGKITVWIWTAIQRWSKSATVTGTLITASDTFRIDITLDNGEVVSTTFAT